MEDFENVTDFENLYRSYRKAKSGKGYRNSSARFTVGSLDGIHTLKRQLENGEYQISQYHRFTVYEPKKRLIEACEFKDKVVQHSLCDNVLLTRLASEFIDRNFAGQIGKGTFYGLDYLKRDMEQFYEEHGMNGWFLKCDISKFFYSIEHEKLKDIVDYHFSELNGINHLLIDSVKSPGVPLGNLTSQVYALLFLNGLDRFITGELGIKYYGRYMDDFYLIHHDKEYLKWCLEGIALLMESLDLKLNSKTQIIPFQKGLSFTGFHTYITTDGKVIRKLLNEKKRHAKRKYGKMAKLVLEGELSEKKFYQSYGSWKSHIEHGNCVKFGYSMDKYINDILDRSN
jgi:RNA-directed DNA polymerase